MKKEVVILLSLLLISGCVKQIKDISDDYKVKVTNLNSDLDNYPIILLHGHAVSVGEAANFLREYKETGSFGKFSAFQERLDIDKLYFNKNIILPSENINEICIKKDWDKKTSIRTTYYVNDNGEFDDQQSIETYAKRLEKVVDILKECTKSSKVNLMGHSMGGLVIREYAKNHPQDVNKVITIGTPNKGISGEYLGIKSSCPTFRYEDDIECKEMTVGSDFLMNLEDNQKINYYSIAGILGSKGYLGSASCFNYGNCNDGVVCTQLSELKNGKNYIVYTQETKSFLNDVGNGIHADLIEPDTVLGQEVYNIVKNILMNKSPEENFHKWDNICKSKNQINYNEFLSKIDLIKEKIITLLSP